MAGFQMVNGFFVKHDKLASAWFVEMIDQHFLSQGTRGEVPNFQQVGIIFQEGDDSSKKILPIYGRPTYIGSNHWLYYTTNDNYNAVKLPIEFNNKNCLDEYGCKELYNGENISVKGYINSFKVELYKFNKPRYIPYIIT